MEASLSRALNLVNYGSLTKLPDDVFNMIKTLLKNTLESFYPTPPDLTRRVESFEEETDLNTIMTTFSTLHK